MFNNSDKFEKFDAKVWLSSPTMHGPENKVCNRSI